MMNLSLLKHNIASATVSLLFVPTASFAQYVTYNHDETVMQQFLMGEGCGGSYTPAVYYDTFHKSYRSTALATGKNQYRLSMYYALLREKGCAENIDSVLVDRTKIEALNVADRSVDVAWLAESGKVQGKLDELSAAIQKIIPAGGTMKDKEYYDMRYKCLTTALDEIRDAYEPNSNRKREYLAIYHDAAVQLTNVNNCIVYYKVAKSVKDRKNGKRPSVNVGSIATSAHGRWKIAMAQAGGK